MTDENPVQEVRYCLKTLRKQMEARQNKMKSQLQIAVKDSETKVEEKERQMHMDSLKLENATLQKKLSANEAELEKLRQQSDKYEKLKQELGVQQQKNFFLDDMLKSQQKKLRDMIVQVNISRMEITNKTIKISNLNEKVSFLEAENKELHDRLCHLDKQEQQTKIPEQQTKIPDKESFSPEKKTLPFLLARMKY